jgi:hypothetical protein
MPSRSVSCESSKVTCFERKMSGVGFGEWIRGLFSSNAGEEQAAEREEYGLPSDRIDRETEIARLGGFAGSEATQAAQDELGEFKAPRDPAP